MKSLMALIALALSSLCAWGQTRTIHAIHSVGANGYTEAASKAVDYELGHLALTSWWVNGQGADIYISRGDTCMGYNSKSQYYRSPGTRDEFGLGIQMDASGDMWVVGYTDGFGAGGSDGFLLKVDTAVNLPMDFARTYGGVLSEELYSLDLNTDGGAILCGSTGSFGAGALDGYVVKVDANGVQQWANAIGGAGEDVFLDVEQTSDGGYVLTGHTTTAPFAPKLWMVKLDATGAITFSAEVGTVFTGTAGWAIEQTADGGFIVSGVVAGAGPGTTNGYVVRLDPSGVVIWDRLIGGAGDEIFLDVEQTDDDADGLSDDGYFVTGNSSSFSGNLDVFYAKFDPSGVVIWSRHLDGFGGNDGMASAVQISSSQGYFMVGTDDMSVSPSLFVLKTLPNGLANFFCVINSPVPTVSPVAATTTYTFPTRVPALGEAPAPFIAYSALSAVAICCCDGFPGVPGCSPAPLAMDGFEWFTLTEANNGVALDWQPRSTECVRYQIWAGGSADEMAWVGETDGLSFMDAFAGKGRRYYQVVGLTTNGESVPSPVKHIDLKEKAWWIAPTALERGGEVMLHGAGKAGEQFEWEVVDAMGGRIVDGSVAAAANGSLGVKIQTAGLSGGMYMVKVNGEALRFVVR